MANSKSARKRVVQSEKRRMVNLARRSAFKTAIKKVHTALEEGADKAKTEDLLKDVQAKLSRAKSKGVIAANTASRKIGRLAKKVAAAHRS